MILGSGCIYSMDCRKTQLNNNVLVTGAAGTGKTESLVIPNLLNAEGSYILCDPKGNLYKKYGDEMRKAGYEVKRVSFIHPGESCGYNPLSCVRSEDDIQKIAHLLVYGERRENQHMDPFWDETSELLLSALIAYILEFCDDGQRNLQTLNSMIRGFRITENAAVPEENYRGDTDRKFRWLEETGSDSFALRQYRQFRQAADRTLKSILISTSALTGKYDVDGLNRMMRTDEVHFDWIGQRKSAVFVEVSDNDRSKDTLANIFFGQAIQELCRYADDKCEGNELRIPVRLILDDFATNVTIQDFPRMISSFRSRRISVMLMIQAESQLWARYGQDAQTIIGNCDSCVYLGSSDLAQAEAIAKRAGRPVDEILNMEIGLEWIFRRGMKPVETYRFDRRNPHRPIYRSEKKPRVCGFMTPGEDPGTDHDGPHDRG